MSTIFLIGFMGAGKTTMAKQIAQQFAYTYIDTDEAIEQQHNQTIKQLFENKGEVWFRKAEADLLRSITPKQNTIIATGGGLPCYHNNMNWMNNKGTTVYLKYSVEELANRLKTEVSHRPLLQFSEETEFIAHVKELLAQRTPYYEQAKFVILSNLISPQTIINTTISDC